MDNFLKIAKSRGLVASPTDTNKVRAIQRRLKKANGRTFSDGNSLFGREVDDLTPEEHADIESSIIESNDPKNRIEYED